MSFQVRSDVRGRLHGGGNLLTTGRPSSSLFSFFPKIRLGPPPVPDAALLQPMKELADGPEEVTTEAYAAAINSVSKYAKAYKVAVPQRSVETWSTDPAVFAAQAACASGLYTTAIASGRFLLCWAQDMPDTSSHAPSKDRLANAMMVFSALEESLQAWVCFYTGFLEHPTLPDVLETAVEDMERHFTVGADSPEGFGVLVILGQVMVQRIRDLKADLSRVRATAASKHAAEMKAKLRGLTANRQSVRRKQLVDEMETKIDAEELEYKLRCVDEAVMVHDMLDKLVKAIVMAQEHQMRYERETWDTTWLLLKVRLVMFDLAVAISGQFVEEIRQYDDHQDGQSAPDVNQTIEYGDWDTKARTACQDAVDLMHALLQDHGPDVLTRVAPDAEGDDDADEAMDEDADEEWSDSDDREGDDADTHLLDKTPLDQLFQTFMRFRVVMGHVWSRLPADESETRFDLFLQPPVRPVMPGDGSVLYASTDEPMPTASVLKTESEEAATPPIPVPAPAPAPPLDPDAPREWSGWDQFGLELCRRLPKAELAKFEEHNLDPELHKRWRAMLRKLERKDAKRRGRPLSRSVSEKRRAGDSEDEDDGGARAKRRKSFR